MFHSACIEITENKGGDGGGGGCGVDYAKIGEKMCVKCLLMGVVKYVKVQLKQMRMLTLLFFICFIIKDKNLKLRSPNFAVRRRLTVN